MKKTGYLFVYLSYNNDSNNWVCFDDFKVTHTPTNVIQYNEYYPFGLQTSNSWTREDSFNDYLYNAGSELNGNSGWYETFFRGYDPVLGRFMQVDPMAAALPSHSPYNFGLNDPVYYNDPMGDYVQERIPPMFVGRSLNDIFGADGGGSGGTWRIGPGSGNYWTDQYGIQIGGPGYSDWTLSVGDIAINYGSLPNGIHNFGFSGGQVSSYSWQADANSPAMGAEAASTYWETGIMTTPYSEGPRLYQSDSRLWFSSTADGLTIPVFAQQGGPGDPPVNSASNDMFPWSTVAGGVVGNFGLGTSITLHQITKGGTQVRLAQKGAYVGAKSLSTKLGLVGVGISLVDIGANGVNTGRALDVVMGGVAFIPVVGWGISATYFVGNLITIGVTGQSIGDHIQGAITGEDGTKAWKPW